MDSKDVPKAEAGNPYDAENEVMIEAADRLEAMQRAAKEKAKPADAIAGLLAMMTKGQYLIFIEALKAAGGEIRIDPAALEQAALTPSPKINIDGDDGPVVIRLVQE